MATDINPTQLTPPRVPLIDERTGAIAREWYRFFLSLLTATQDGTAADVIGTSPDASAMLASYMDGLRALAEEIQTQPRAELGTLAPVNQDNVPWLTFNADPSPVPAAVGSVFWNGGNTLNVQQTLNVAGKVNEDNFYYIKATADILKGRLVMFTGAVGASGVMTGAPASAGLAIDQGYVLMGLAAEDIATNDFGLVQWSGTLKGFNTGGAAVGETWADGDILYYNPAYPGRMTNVEPTAPNVKAIVAAVVYASNGNSGSVVIRLTPGSVLGGTDSNVNFGTLADGDVIQYDATNAYWTNAPASSVSSGSYTPTLTNVTNVAASTAYDTAWMQVGSTVNVGGRVQIDPTATGSISLGMTIPVASNFGAIADVGGTFQSANGAIIGVLSADTVNDRFTLTGTSTTTAATNCYFNVTYKVI